MNKRKTSLGDSNVVTTVKPVTYSVTDMNKTKTPEGDGNPEPPFPRIPIFILNEQKKTPIGDGKLQLFLVGSVWCSKLLIRISMNIPQKGDGRA